MNTDINRIQITISAINTDGEPIAQKMEMLTASELLRTDDIKQTVYFKVSKSLEDILAFLRANKDASINNFIKGKP